MLPVLTGPSAREAVDEVVEAPAWAGRPGARSIVLVTQIVPSQVFERMVALRRDLHRHPELSGEEERTGARIVAQLEELGLKPRRMAGTGVVADICGEREGARIALRADMDALPIQEETGLEFASIHDGVMHACGHDGHSSMLLGAAELLLRDPPPGPVRLIWEPAEERGQGAPALIGEGVLDGVEAIFGGHVDRRYPAGVLVVTEGAVNAATNRFTIRITGLGGHGARPHEALDAVVVGSLLVIAIQTIVSREVDPAHPSVISVGSFHAGRAANVIADEAVLEGTIRCLDDDVRSYLQQAIRRIAQAVGQLHGAKVDVEISRGMPPVINTARMTELAREAASDVVGADRVVSLHTANMGAEDFAWFLDHVEGCYIRIGAQVPGHEGYPAHSSRFDIDEQALAAGAAWFAQVARTAGSHSSDRPHNR